MQGAKSGIIDQFAAVRRAMKEILEYNATEVSAIPTVMTYVYNIQRIYKFINTKYKHTHTHTL